MTAKQINEIESLRAQGFGYKKIASEMGIPENTIKSFFRRITRSTTKQERVTSRTTPYQDNPQSNGGCLYCGKPVVQAKGRKEKKFCSDQCRAHWWNRNKTRVPGKNRISGICPTCGNEFFPILLPHENTVHTNTILLEGSMGDRSISVEAQKENVEAQHENVKTGITQRISLHFNYGSC